MYSFEGAYRTKPKQSLGGASRKVMQVFYRNQNFLFLLTCHTCFTWGFLLHLITILFSVDLLTRKNFFIVLSLVWVYFLNLILSGRKRGTVKKNTGRAKETWGKCGFQIKINRSVFKVVVVFKTVSLSIFQAQRKRLQSSIVIQSFYRGCKVREKQVRFKIDTYRKDLTKSCLGRVVNLCHSVGYLFPILKL